VGSLRDAQLRAAGAPERPSGLADDVVLMKGRCGTTGRIKPSCRLGGFVLGDLTTIKGNGIPWINNDGPSLSSCTSLNHLPKRGRDAQRRSRIG